MIVRQEKPSEFQSIYDFVKVAFQTAKVADGSEQDYVNRLRASGNYIHELALVAEKDTKLVAHVMLTKTSVKRGGSKFEALLLVPLSVAFEYRKRGIGLRMVKESFELARNIGYRFVFVVGNPPHFIVGSVSSHPVLFSALSMFLQFLTKTLWFMSYTLAH